MLFTMPKFAIRIPLALLLFKNMRSKIRLALMPCSQSCDGNALTPPVMPLGVRLSDMARISTNGSLTHGAIFRTFLPRDSESGSCRPLDCTDMQVFDLVAFEQQKTSNQLKRSVCVCASVMVCISMMVKNTRVYSYTEVVKEETASGAAV